MRTDPNILKHPGLNPLWESMERTRIQQQVTAVALMIAGLVLAVVGVVGRNLWFPFAGGALATAALYWLYRILSDQPIAYWRRELRENPENIVWVYGMVTERMPFGFRLSSMATLHLTDRNGDMHCFGLKPKELKLVTKTLNRVLPHAEFGYSPEQEMKFRGEVTDFRDRMGQELF